MLQELKTLKDLKLFLETLDDVQLLKPIIQATGEDAFSQIESVQIFESDQINPSGDGIENLDDYLPGGEFHDEDYDPNDEDVIFKKGDIVFYSEYLHLDTNIHDNHELLKP